MKMMSDHPSHHSDANKDKEEAEVIFVGIGGCSSSGKTTLSRGILRLLQMQQERHDDDEGSSSSVAEATISEEEEEGLGIGSVGVAVVVIVEPAIRLDWYMDPTRMPPIITSKEEEAQDEVERNWETPDGIRYDLLVKEMDRLKEFLLLHGRMNQTQPQEEEEFCRCRDGASLTYTIKAVQPKEVQLRIAMQDNNQSKKKNKNRYKRKYYVVVEGFLLYYWKEIVQRLQYKFWIETSYETALQRRLNRDLPTKLHHPHDRQEFEGWFQQHIWFYYEKYRTNQLQNLQQLTTRTPATTVCRLDADSSIQDQFKCIQKCLLSSQQHQNLLREAVYSVQVEINQDKVPQLTTQQDQDAMDLVGLAEQAEQDGNIMEARKLYNKVIRLSPKVAKFVGL